PADGLRTSGNDYGPWAAPRQVRPGFRAQTRTYNSRRPARARRHFATDADLRRQLRHGRQAADRAVEDGRRQPVPPDLDRASGGGRDPDEASGRLDAPADDARPAVGPARSARREVRAGVGDR